MNLINTLNWRVWTSRIIPQLVLNMGYVPMCVANTPSHVRCNSLVCCQPPTGVFATQKTQDVTVTQESKKYTIIFIILYEIYYIHRKILSFII